MSETTLTHDGSDGKPLPVDFRKAKERARIALLSAPKLDPAAKVVAVVIVEHASFALFKETGRLSGWPSLDRLIVETGMSRSTVARARHDLRKTGAMIVTENSKGGRGAPARYTVSPEWMDAMMATLAERRAAFERETYRREKTVSDLTPFTEPETVSGLTPFPNPPASEKGVTSDGKGVKSAQERVSTLTPESFDRNPVTKNPSVSNETASSRDDAPAQKRFHDWPNVEIQSADLRARIATIASTFEITRHIAERFIRSCVKRHGEACVEQAFEIFDNTSRRTPRFGDMRAAINGIIKCDPRCEELNHEPRIIFLDNGSVRREPRHSTATAPVTGTWG